MSRKSNSVDLCIKYTQDKSSTLLPDANKVRESFKTKPGQPPKHIYRVSNLKATTLLQKAVVNSNIEQLEKLLTRAVDLSRKWKNGDTPLSYSVKKSNLAMTEFLLANGANPNISDKQGEALLHLAVDQEDKEMAELLLQYKADPNISDKYGQPPLHLAVDQEDKEMAELLLQYKADPNISDKYGRIPLHLAVSTTYSREDKEMAKLLLAHKADPNIQDKQGETPLHLAVDQEDKEMTKLLLAYNANSNIQDKKGETPLHLAVDQKDNEMAALLLEHGADPNISDKDGRIPLYLAVSTTYSREDNGMAALLLEHGADPNKSNKYDRTPLHLALEKVDIAVLSKKCNKVRAYYEITELLLKYGADPNILYNSGYAALYWTVDISKNKEMTKLLVEKGANPNRLSKYYPESHLVREAIISGDKDDVKFFVQYGSFVDIEYRNSSNILDYALRNGHKEMAAIILENMSDKNISDPSKGPLLDPILSKIISNQLYHKESKNINNIQRVSELLEIFTVNNSNLNNKGCLFGITTLPLLERIYDLSLFQLNKNIQKLEIVNGRGCNKSFSKDPSKQEGINDHLLLNQEEINYDLSLEILNHNFKGFVYNFIQVFSVTEEVLEKYPLICELSLNCGSRNLKSARKDIVLPEQSPTFHKTTNDTTEIVNNDQNQYSNCLSLSGQQDTELENY